MSFAQASEELQTRTRPQRREISLRLFEIKTTEAEADDIAVCEHSPAMGFAMLDGLGRLHPWTVQGLGMARTRFRNDPACHPAGMMDRRTARTQTPPTQSPML